MARKKRTLSDTPDDAEKKEPVELAARTGSLGDSDITTNINSITKVLENQDLSDDESESQLFNPSGNYRQPVDDNVKARHWLFIVYLESAPPDWKERLIATGIPFTISEPHDRDVNPDGSHKKTHFHGIISYPNTTTYRTIKEIRKITNGPFPIKCHSVSGSYAYFCHKWNPEKYQYPGTGIERYNGWEKVLEASDIAKIKLELTRICLMEDIREYAELITRTLEMDGDYTSVAMNNTVYFNAFIRSYRHSPIMTLRRFYNLVDTDEERDMIASRIDNYADIEAERELKE